MPRSQVSTRQSDGGDKESFAEFKLMEMEVRKNLKTERIMMKW